MLIFFDIDGTLIDEETHEFPADAKAAIAKARKEGHICVINSGRSEKLFNVDKDKLTGFDGMLLGCGTRIVYHDEVLLHKTFTPEEGRRIIEGLKKYHIDAVLEGTYDNFCDSDENIFTQHFRDFIHAFDSLHYRPYEEAIGNFDKFYTYTPSREDINGFMEEFSDLLEMVDRKYGNYEIMPIGHSKASAMRFLADKLGIPMEQTAAIGDSSNDIPMIECAHFGIAMGNASADVKAISDYVTTDINEGGIAEALRYLSSK